MNFTVTQGPISVTVGLVTSAAGPEPHHKSVGSVTFHTSKGGEQHMYLNDAQISHFLSHASEQFKAEADRLRALRKAERDAERDAERAED